mgnify:CR=1 FL=1
MRKDMLFIEKCIRLIKPGGRIAIVLPQGNLNNPTSEFLRNFIFENCRLLGCVGLKENTFGISFSKKLQKIIKENDKLKQLAEEKFIEIDQLLRGAAMIHT